MRDVTDERRGESAVVGEDGAIEGRGNSEKLPRDWGGGEVDNEPF